MKKRTIIALICMGAAVYIYNTSALEESPTTEYGAAVMPVMPEMPAEPMAHPTDAEKMTPEPAQTPEMVSGMPTEQQPGGIEYQAPGVQVGSPAAATNEIVQQGNAEMVPVPQEPTESESQDDNDDIDQDEDEDDDSLLDYTDFI